METNNFPVAVVGLGLMGCSIVTCLLMANHPVIALAPIASDLDHAATRIREHLQRSFAEKITNKDPELLLKNLTITENDVLLKPCKLVIECTVENQAIKENVYQRI